jgi:hypothetical protein
MQILIVYKTRRKSPEKLRTMLTLYDSANRQITTLKRILAQSRFECYSISHWGKAILTHCCWFHDISYELATPASRSSMETRMADILMITGGVKSTGIMNADPESRDPAVNLQVLRSTHGVWISSHGKLHAGWVWCSLQNRTCLSQSPPSQPLHLRYWQRNNLNLKRLLDSSEIDEDNN